MANGLPAMASTLAFEHAAQQIAFRTTSMPSAEEIAAGRSASARYAALEAGQCRGALVTTMSLDARHLDRGSPKRDKVMRPDPGRSDC